MGREIQAIKFSGEDRRVYREKVRRSLDALARMLREHLFEDHPASVGQEIELHLVDSQALPSMHNTKVMDAITAVENIISSLCWFSGSLDNRMSRV
jgi:hypothetical protein